MYRVASRTIALWVLVAVLLGGMVFFLLEYFAEADSWVMKPENPNVYDEGGVALGTVFDRNGNLLVDLTDGRTYSNDPWIRSAMLHWTGDRLGNVQVSVLKQYEQALAGYDPVGGLYDYGGLGGNLNLTLSARVQCAALEALGSYKGTLAVYNYQTGQLVCAVSAPSFDPDNAPDIDGDTTGAYDGVYWNRFLQSAYVPGSIFKIVTTAAALEEIEDIRSRMFHCTGTLEFGVDKVTCERAHGMLNLEEAMMRSCNCAYAQIGLLIGAEKMEKYVSQFGVTQRVHFDGITTAAGNYQAIGSADVEVAWSAVGQYRDLINPCTYLTFVGAIANGGQGVMPYVVESVRVGNLETYSAQVTAGKRIISMETSQILRDFMRNNVVNNYGAEHFPGLKVCAKSGTAQTVDGKRPNAMFAGFVDDPQYPFAFIVAVEDAGYGAKVCVPMIASVLQACKDMVDQGQ